MVKRKPGLELLDPSTHEFTLEALMTLFDNHEVLSRKLRRVNFKSKVRFGAALGALIYAYKKLDQRIKKLEDNEVISEE